MGWVAAALDRGIDNTIISNQQARTDGPTVAISVAKNSYPRVNAGKACPGTTLSRVFNGFSQLRVRFGTPEIR